MDPFTHGLLGALTAQAATHRKEDGSVPSVGSTTAAGTLAALFPDLDYLLFWLDPLRFLADWHRGISHSLLMLPLWALLLGLLFSTLHGQRRSWKRYSGFCALGLLSHIVADLLTTYGTQLFAPFSDYRLSLSLSYVVDPYFTAILLLTVMLLIGRHRKSAPPRRFLLALSPSRIARLGLLMLLPYLCLQALLQHQAKALGERQIREQGLVNAEAYALPQPLSPLNWKVIVTHQQGYRVALVHLHGKPLLPIRLPGPGWLQQQARAYRTVDNLDWQNYLRPDQVGVDELIREVWNQAAFSRFREFARYPILAGIERGDSGDCVWFTDLRYTLPAIRPFFRYGMCRDSKSVPWRLYRLLRYTDNQRQALKTAMDPPLLLPSTADNYSHD
ncbi:MAG: metal-dependent hydrolase [Motiliproteus sp.]